jgi:CheY-like chemotaxis protein
MAKTILLADDSVTIRKVVELTFSDTDIRVESVASGQEALDKLATVLPDLVLADVAMPSPSGYEICEEIKSSSRPVPVLLLAGTFEPFDGERARACGADGHLVKPFESTVLIERVEALLSPPAEPVAAPQTQAPPAPDDGELEAALDSLAADTQPDSGGAPTPGPANDPTPRIVREAPRAGSEASAAPRAAERPVAEAPNLNAEQLDAIARAVVERLSSDVLREIVWEIVPDLAESIIRERIRELEHEVEG